MIPSQSQQSGFSLVGVLMLTAVIGIIAVALVAIVTGMFRSQSQVTAEAAADSLNNLSYAILTNSNLCDSALYSGGALLKIWPKPVVSMPNANITVDSVQLPGPIQIAQTGQAVAPRLTISRMVFSKTQWGQDLDPPAPFDYGGTTYDRYSGWFTIYYSTTSGAVKSRPFQLNLLMNPANGQLVHCNGANSVQQICAEMGGTMTAGGGCANTLFAKAANKTCSAGTVTTGYNCGALPGNCAAAYSFIGFLPTGDPICSCQQICY